MEWLPTVDSEHLEPVLASWSNLGRPYHLLALLPEAQSDKVALLQSVCRAWGIPVAGAIFPELIVGSTLSTSGAVLLRVVSAPPPFLLSDVSRPEAVGTTAAALGAYVEENLRDEDEGTLFCTFDVLVPNIGTHLDAWYLRMADRVRYVGANAGNERFAPAPCLFDADRFLGDGLLVQLLPNHPGACLEHGYRVPKRITAATSAVDNRIVQIDWRPALDVYRELMREEYGVHIDETNFYDHAVHFPFGIIRADGEVVVRIPVALGEDGSIVCVGEMPANSVLTLLDARSGSDLAPAKVASGLKELRTGTAGTDTLVFYCAGRRLHKGDGVTAELEELRRDADAERLYGAVSLGEIGQSRDGGYPLFHNATLVGVPWPNR
jgi:hypothetical protein